MAMAPTASRDPTIADAIVAGIVASIAYTVVTQIVVVGLYGSGAFFTPFRQIVAVAVGPQALSPDYNLTAAVGLGTAVHVLVGIGYALVFLAIAKAADISKSGLVVAGVVYGVLIYALNLFVIFPRWFPWFLANDPLIQVTLHALAFGLVIGWWLSRKKAR